MPKVTDKEDFVKAWSTYDPDVVLDGFKSEASRMTVEMDEWAKTQEQYDPDMMYEIYVEAGYLDLVKLAKRYRKRIYNRNIELKKLIVARDVAEIRAKQTQQRQYADEYTEAVEKISELQDEQIVYCWKISKIYGHLVVKKGINLLSVVDGEYDDAGEYEYDPEES